MPETLLEAARFVCLDTETTGLSPIERGRVCEIACLASQGGKRAGSLCTLINPGAPISPEVTKIHGITDEMVAESPAFAGIAPALINMLHGGVIVCHNADFDIAFLEAEFVNTGLKIPQCIVLDTLKFARCHGSFSRNQLGIIAKELGISNEGWHRAMADAIMTEKIFYYFLNKFRRMGARTVGDLCNFQTKKTQENIIQ
jgi:DNA polymerase III epsilon subunit family exonuclease